MATFGWTDTPSASSASSTDKVAVSLAAPAQTGIVATGHAWLSISGGSTAVRFVIYANNGGTPGTRLAQSDEIVLTGATQALREFVFSGSNKIQVVAGTNYWIGVTWADPGSPSLSFYRLSGGTRMEGNGYSPNPFGAATSLSGPLALYVTFDTATQIGPITDAGVGTDPATVAKTQFIAPLADSGAGTDAPSSYREATPLAEGGTGSEALAVEILYPIGPVTDGGTGSEALEVAEWIGNDLTEQGTGSDAISVERLTFVHLTDTGVGNDSRALQQTRNVTDQGIGTDTRTAQSQPHLTDGGTGSEFLVVTDIPFTQVLPLRLGTLYELVVVARIPQANGPPHFIEVDPIEWSSLTYTNTLSQPQELEATCQLTSVTEPVLQRLRSPDINATELWLYRNGQVVFAGPLAGWRSSGDETLSISAKGLLAYLRLMMVTADLRFDQVDQFAIVKALVDHWQNQEYGNFGVDTANVALSGVLRDASYLKVEQHNIGQRVEELGRRENGFDVEVDPASRQLQLWYPGKGIDRSTGEDAIVIDERNITSSDVVCSVAIGDLASEAYGSGSSAGGDSTLWSEKANLELRSKYGRSAVAASWSDVSRQETLDDHTLGLLNARGAALIVPGPKTRVTPDADLADYSEGDTINYTLSGALGVTGAYRIRRQRIAVSSTGQESVDLEFV